jgi:hypothetical protein
VGNRRIAWIGQSGVKYTYNIFDFGTTFEATPANYIFAQEKLPRQFVPIHIGQTRNLTDCYKIPQLACIQENGTTHICVHANLSGEKARLAEEADLINAYRPVCNT